MLNKNFVTLNYNHAITFASEHLILDAAGAVYWPQQRLLLVADLHLEKGSYFAQRGNPLPNYDTRDTLQRLERLIIQYQVQKVICLGDNLHDFSAIERMLPEDYNYLCQLNQGVNWLWIIGNHDTNLIQHPLLKSFRFEQDLQLNSLLLSHELNPKAALQIIGHFHPKAMFRIRSHTITGKCFLVSDSTIIMPAFGSYAGGLDIATPVFDTVIEKSKTDVYFLKDNKIWLLPIFNAKKIK